MTIEGAFDGVGSAGGGGGGGSTSFGIAGRAASGDTINALTANDLIVPVIDISEGTILRAIIANPYDYDIKITGTADAGSYSLFTPGYTGRLSTFCRMVDQGVTDSIIIGNHASTYRDNDVVGGDPNPVANTFAINTPAIPFQVLILANTSIEIGIGVGLAATDDGSAGTYVLATDRMPSMTWVGVPVE